MSCCILNPPQSGDKSKNVSTLVVALQPAFYIAGDTPKPGVTVAAIQPPLCSILLEAFRIIVRSLLCPTTACFSRMSVSQSSVVTCHLQFDPLEFWTLLWNFESYQVAHDGFGCGSAPRAAGSGAL